MGNNGNNGGIDQPEVVDLSEINFETISQEEKESIYTEFIGSFESLGGLSGNDAYSKYDMPTGSLWFLLGAENFMKMSDAVSLLHTHHAYERENMYGFRLGARYSQGDGGGEISNLEDDMNGTGIKNCIDNLVNFLKENELVQLPNDGESGLEYERHPVNNRLVQQRVENILVESDVDRMLSDEWKIFFFDEYATLALSKESPFYDHYMNALGRMYTCLGLDGIYDEDNFLEKYNLKDEAKLKDWNYGKKMGAGDILNRDDFLPGETILGDFRYRKRIADVSPELLKEIEKIETYLKLNNLENLELSAETKESVMSVSTKVLAAFGRLKWWNIK